MWDWHGGWGGWAAMMVMMGGFWVLLVAGLVLVLRGPGRPWDQRAHEGRSRALAILEERFARGELSDEEFRARRDALSPP